MRDEAEPTEEGNELGSTASPTLDAAPSHGRGRRLEPGARIARYTVRRPLGEGGMGVVYEAHDPKLDRTIALKLLKPAGDETRDERRRHRLLREAQAIARLSHPNVVEVLDAGTHEGQVYLAMELVDGPTMYDWLARRRSFDEVMPIMLQVARGVQSIHAAGLVHRDLKPENVMVGSDGRPRVMDLGLVRANETSASGTDQEEHGRLAVGLTNDAGVVGTVGYIPPEAYGGRKAGPPGDQFAYCVLVYEALAGHRPHPGMKAMEIAASVIEGRIVAPPRRAMSRRVEAVLRRGMAVRPSERWPDMTALLDALQGATQSPRRTRWAVLGVSALALVAVAVGVGGRASRPDCAEETEHPACVAQEEEEAASAPRGDEPLEVKKARKEVVDAHRLSFHGEMAQARARVQAVLDGPVATEHQVVRAFALAELGILSCRTHDLDPCMSHLEESYNLAYEVGDTDTAARAAAYRAGRLAGEQRIADARRWLRMAESAAGESPTPIISASIYFSEGTILTAESRYGEALVAFEAGAALETEPLQRATFGQPISRTLYQLGRFDEAYRVISSTVSALEAGLGRSNPQLASVLSERASLAQLLGDAELAQRDRARVIALLKGSDGQTHSSVAHDLLSRAAVMRDGGDPEGSLEVLAAAHAAAKAHGGDSVSVRIRVYEHEVEALLDLERTDEAIVKAARALTMAEDRYGAGDQELVTFNALLAGAYLAAGDHEAAVRYQSKAVELARPSGGPRLAISIANLAQSELAAGHDAAAAEHATTALQMGARMLSEDDPRFAATHAVAAIALRRIGRAEDAGRHIDLALGGLKQWASDPDQIEIDPRFIVSEVAAMAEVVDTAMLRENLEEVARRLRAGGEAWAVELALVEDSLRGI